MRNWFAFLFLFISSFLFAQSGGAIRPNVNVWQQPDGKKGSYAALDSVEITVYIPGATDTLHGFTDSLGELRFKSIPAGIYTLKAKLNGFVPIEYKNIFVSELKTTYVTITMVPEQVITAKTAKKNRKKKTGR